MNTLRRSLWIVRVGKVFVRRERFTRNTLLDATVSCPPFRYDVSDVDYHFLGARSWVREAVGIRMDRVGSGTSIFFSLADLTFTPVRAEEDPVNFGVLNFTPSGNFPDCTLKTVISTPLCGMLGVESAVHVSALLR